MSGRWFLALLAPVCFAQGWEMGVLAGGGIGRAASYGSAQGGVAPGPAFGVLLGQDWGKRLGGDVRYTFLMQDVRLTKGATETAFSGQSHALHYQLQVYATESGAKVRPYVLGGGGYKLYRGTGDEIPYRPLMDQAWLTKTAEWKPMVVAGGGIKIALSRSLSLRLEVSDQLTPAPKQVITPAPGVGVSGWVHDVVPMFALVWRIGSR
jgi:hypothetical protein